MNVLYGRHAVLEALKSGQTLEKIYLLQSRRPDEALLQIRSISKSRGIPVLLVPLEKLNRLARHDKHQGAAAVMAAREYASLESILKASEGSGIVVVLDHLEDPQNLGSLLRTCDALGVSGVIVPGRRAAGLSAGAAKASAGAAAYVPVARVSNLHQVLLRLKKSGYMVVGADPSAETSFNESDYTLPLALVLGNEHKGVSRLLKKTCDQLVKIPIQGRIGSLNVSVAGALILYQIFSQKGPQTSV